MDPNQQQLLLGYGGGEKSTYVDDVFSTYLYEGNASAQGTPQQIVNGVDNTEGGLVWIKSRGGINHMWLDTARVSGGLPYELQCDNNAAQAGPYAGYNITAFNNNGFKLEGNGGHTNQQGQNYVSWNFRKAPGFFDIVTWEGNATSGRQLPHNLGCIPGTVIVKQTDGTEDWTVYHRDTGKDIKLKLNTTASTGGTSSWNNVVPTSTYVELGSNTAVNQSGKNYVAYLFAGGSSTEDGAHSIFYNSPAGTVRRILCGDSGNTTADFNFGTGDLTIECWVKCSASQGDYPRVVAFGPQWQAEMAALQWDHDSNANRVTFYCYNHSSSTTAPLLKSRIFGFNNDGQYHHLAVTRSGNTWRLFVDGVLEDQETWSGSTNTANSYCTIGNTPGSATTAWFGGYISNVRVVKGQAVYTTSFRPSLEPLTTTSQGATSSNVKLLCCNNLSGTTATVTPIALTETNINQNQIDNPFDDPKGFKFGKDNDQNLVKCGSYIGAASHSTEVEVKLGFEPQWILIKDTQGSGGTDDWVIFDPVRKWSATESSNARWLEANESNAEQEGSMARITSTGFICKDSSFVNGSSHKFIYVAIRRADGYVGKPAAAGTDVFAMDAGAGGSTIPNFDSNFPVDFALNRTISSTADWYSSTRKTAGEYLVPNATTAGSSDSGYSWDSNKGWGSGTYLNSARQSWMWKRHAGCDVVAYKGNGLSPRGIIHNLGKTPEMIWIKNRDNTNEWMVGHIGLNDGTNPWEYSIHLQNTDAEVRTDWVWKDTPPTSTSFTVHSDGYVNGGNQNYIAMLFASVDGISKCGYYDGVSGTDITITTGFQPRFVIIKATNNTRGWTVMDTTRGWGSGVDNKIMLNDSAAQVNTWNYGEPTATGFTVSHSQYDINYTGWKYIYYAHA